MLRILVDPRRIDGDLMASIGHELQHAVEVLSDRAIRSSSAMTLLYNKEGDKLVVPPYRTDVTRNEWVKISSDCAGTKVCSRMK